MTECSRVLNIPTKGKRNPRMSLLLNWTSLSLPGKTCAFSHDRPFRQRPLGLPVSGSICCERMKPTQTGTTCLIRVISSSVNVARTHAFFSSALHEVINPNGFESIAKAEGVGSVAPFSCESIAEAAGIAETAGPAVGFETAPCAISLTTNPSLTKKGTWKSTGCPPLSHQRWVELRNQRFLPS